MSAERIINPSTHSLPVYNVLDGSPLLALHMQAFDLEEFGHLLTIDTHGAEQTLHLGLDIFLRLLLELLPLTILPVVPRRLHTLAPALSNHPVVHSSGVTLTPGMRCAWLSTCYKILVVVLYVQDSHACVLAICRGEHLCKGVPIFQINGVFRPRHGSVHEFFGQDQIALIGLADDIIAVAR